jgi:predicted GIY-YIG superfamily endonuclease
MSEERRYFVYIMANASKRVYTGMTNSLRRRVGGAQTKADSRFRGEVQHHPTGLLREF